MEQYMVLLFKEIATQCKAWIEDELFSFCFYRIVS